MIMYLMFLVFFWSLVSFMYLYNKFLLNIISIEFMIISMGLVIFFTMNMIGMEYFMIIYFIFGVVESVLLLCLLVMFININGSDKVDVLNLQF